MEDVVSKLIFLFQDIPEMPERRMTDSIGEVFIKFELTLLLVNKNNISQGFVNCFDHFGPFLKVTSSKN